MNNEPVVWRKVAGNVTHYYIYNEMGEGEPLYTHPHPDNLGFALSIIDQQKLEIERLKAKTLTDEEIAQAWAETKGDILHRLMPFARAILKKANEK